MRIQSLTEAEVTLDGIPGDRAFFLVDEQRRMVNGKRFGALMAIRPEYDPAARQLALNLPDGSSCSAPIAVGESEEVTFFGQPLWARPVDGPFSEAVSHSVGAALTLMERPPDRPAVDRGQIAGVTLLGSASVSRLEREGVGFDRESRPPEGHVRPGSIDSRRFRMSIELDGSTAHEEDQWVGRQVRIGETLVEVGGHVGRCAVTTRDPETGASDLRTLHYLKAYRGETPATEPLPFGVYAQVLRPGRIRVGDEIVPA